MGFSDVSEALADVRPKGRVPLSGEFPKIRCRFLEAPTMRIIAFSGSAYLGKLSSAPLSRQRLLQPLEQPELMTLRAVAIIACRMLLCPVQSGLKSFLPSSCVREWGLAPAQLAVLQDLLNLRKSTELLLQFSDMS